MGLFSGIKKITGKIGGAISNATGGDWLTLGGSLLSGGMSYLGTQATNNASARAAQSANAFTEYQLRNRHQWEVEDLKKAGLNPILSAGGTPSIGGSSSYVPQNELGSAASSALQALRFREEIKNIRADTQLKQDQSSTAVNSALREQAYAYLLGKQAEAQGYDNVSKKLEADVMGTAAGLAITGLKKAAGGIASGAGMVSDAKSIANALKGAKSVGSAASKVWKGSPALKMNH